MSLDNLEYISIENQTTDFPKHFHETFCISLIHNGIEQIDFEGKRLYSEAGSLSITNPYQIHANPLLDSNVQLQFDTIYLSRDLMDYVFKTKKVAFQNEKINSEKAIKSFLELKRAIDSRDAKTIELMLYRFSEALRFHVRTSENAISELNFKDLNDVSTYIDNHIFDKFCLADLSRIANINKFGFVKKFKASTGMTPMNYILMKKIFSSKQLIVPDLELTELAYQYNFSDMAHFSNTFKRYIGLSPKMYQASLTQF